MAVIKQSKTTALILRFETGTSATGATVYSDRTFASMNPGLSDSDAYSVGSGLAELVNYPCNAIKRRDSATLIMN